MLRSRVFWLRVFIAISLSSFLWLLVTLARTYEVTIEYPVTFTNIPQKSIFNQKLPTTVHVSVIGTGQQLLLPSLRSVQDTLQLHIDNEAVAKGNISLHTYIPTIKKNLNYAQAVTRIKPDTIYLDLTEPLSKRLAVIPDITLKLKEDYLLIKKIDLNPDSLWFIGSEHGLSQINLWKTQKVEIDLRNYQETPANQSIDPFELSFDDLQDIEVVKPIRKKVPLEKQHGIFCNTDDVEAVIYIDKFTQAECWTDIEIVNVPANRQVRLIPNRVLIKFQVPFNQYEKINSKNFRLQIDYADLHELGKQIVPILEAKPEFVNHYWLEPKSVKYVIRNL
ncbi:MAG: hypothetical protein LC115_12075 [Bacteroidia bacterium]|nr:hypothetical protein [Bacteroidia bacterium]